MSSDWLRGDGGAGRPVLVNAEAITGLDSTAAQALDEMLDELRKLGVPFGLARVKAPLRARLAAAGLLARIGEDHIYLEVDDGVAAMGEQPACVTGGRVGCRSSG